MNSIVDLVGEGPASSFIELIHKRRSVFPPAFTDEQIPEAWLKIMLSSANMAPTHRLTEPWRFKVLRGQALERLASYLDQYYLAHTPPDQVSEKKREKTRNKVSRSQAVILICMQRDAHARVPEWEELAAVACAVQNMWLTAAALGLGGYWSTPAAIETMDELLPMNTGERCLGLFYLGRHQQPEMPAKRGDWEDKVEWVDE